MTTVYRQNKGLRIDPEQLLEQAHALLQRCQTDGNLILDGHKKTSAEKRNESEARMVAGRIHRLLTARECLPSVPSLLEMYDLLYRIGHGAMPDRRFIELQREKVYKAWLDGNKEIGESSIFRIAPAAVRPRLKESWLRTLIRHNCFPTETAYENYLRLAILMRENLDAEIEAINAGPHDSRVTSTSGFDADELKWTWYKTNIIEDASELAAMSTKLLRAYRTFVQSLFPSLLDWDDLQHLDRPLVALLNSRTLQQVDVNHDRMHLW